MTIKSIIIAFVVGFLAYAAAPMAMDMAYTPDSNAEPLWGLRFYALWGGIGGVAFVVAWFCLVALLVIGKNLIEDKDV